MSDTKKMDHVERIVQQWNKERPDLDTSAMETIGRIKRLAAFFEREMEKTFKKFDLNGASFDVLATLLRSGAPYTLTPSDLITLTMVTSGTMTNRLNQLEKRELIQRIQSDEDKRSFAIKLTEKGYNLINEVIGEHVKTQQNLTKSLNNEQQRELNATLKKTLESFEG